jgi:hypothetical protein
MSMILLGGGRGGGGGILSSANYRVLELHERRGRREGAGKTKTGRGKGEAKEPKWQREEEVRKEGRKK